MQSLTLHPLQEAILQLSRERNIAKMKLREIGRLVGDPSPQKIKHHLQQLEKKGLIKIDRERQVAQNTMHGSIEGFLKKRGSKLFRIPIVGAANCGPAELLAEKNIIGYLRVSNALVHRQSSDDLFAVRANGYSMNQARVNGKTIDDGDLLIVDSADHVPEEGKVILSVIDGAANVKRYHKDAQNNQIALLSDSTNDLAPIYIHEDDDFVINGHVIEVVKRPVQ